MSAATTAVSADDSEAPLYSLRSPPPPKAPGVFRVIAVGDSITFGACSSDAATRGYPARLEQMLLRGAATFDDAANADARADPGAASDRGRPPAFEVVNLGVSGRTMQKRGDHPYWDEDSYALALRSEPDAVLLMVRPDRRGGAVT